jgi:hypothetical protein
MTNDPRLAVQARAEESPLTPEVIAAELRTAGIIATNLTHCVALTGGTASGVTALSRPGAAPELVIKLNAPAEIQAEAFFLDTYRESPLLPTLRQVDPAHRFLVCDFRPGIHVRYGKDHVDVEQVMLTLVHDLLSRYVPYAPAAGPHAIATLAELIERAGKCGGAPEAAGQNDNAARTWPAFLGDHVAYRHERLSAYLPAADLRLVERLARAPRRAEQSPSYVLHGDCGAHNFLFQHRPVQTGARATAQAAAQARTRRLGPLAAVIDPYPLVGPPIRDLVFAFVSWPNGLEAEAIFPAAEALRASGRWQPNGDPHAILCEEVLIALYMRMGTCLVHHPADLPAYLTAWPRWRALVTAAAKPHQGVADDLE